MAVSIEVDGVAYPFPETLNGNDLATIKRIAGVRGGEIKEALAAGDYDLTIALAVIVLGRAGIEADVEKLKALDLGKITAIDSESEEAEEGSPPAVAAGAEPAEPAASGVSTLSTIRPVTREASGGQG